jgi:hypothetical protein
VDDVDVMLPQDRGPFLGGEKTTGFARHGLSERPRRLSRPVEKVRFRME